jgi:DNA repair protein RadC
MKPDTPASENGQYLSIKAWSEDDQPREKFMARGREAVSDAELLGILLGTGTAKESAVDVGRKLMALAGNNLTRLSTLEWRQFKAVKGVGDAKAITLAAALELGRRQAAEAPAQKIFFRTAQDDFELMGGDLIGLKHEQFRVLLLNQAAQLLRKVRVGEGGIAGVNADSRLIFKEALLEGATRLILVHNHPSGNTAPSREDFMLTRRLVEAGALLDIQVADHVIFTDATYYSFSDAGEI